MTSGRRHWTEIAWNGISFYKPSSWEIARIGKRYLMLGTHRYPQMELTWDTGNIRSSFPKDIQKVQNRIFKHHLAAAETWKPYADWTTALIDYKVSGFCWKQSKSVCYGVIVYCPACNSISLIQFFVNNEDFSTFLDTTTHVLSSFADHATGSDRSWVVYDMRISLPRLFQIKSYDFHPGSIKLVYGFQGMQITFYRWSPASVLLTGRKLSQLGELLDLNMVLDRNIQITQKHDRIEWECMPPSPLWKRLTAVIAGRHFHRRVLIRHDPVNNRVLAITAECRQVMDSGLLDRIFSSYGISPD